MSSPIANEGSFFLVDPATTALTLPAYDHRGNVDMLSDAVAEVSSARAYGLLRPAKGMPVVIHGTAHPDHGTVLPYVHVLAGPDGHFDLELNAPASATQIDIEIGTRSAGKSDDVSGHITLDRPGALWPEQPSRREVLILLPHIEAEH
jgi:hypothetical protein